MASLSGVNGFWMKLRAAPLFAKLWMSVAAGLEHQIAQLKVLGVADENLFVERASAVGERPVLEEALRFVRRGDIFVVCKLDRLARSIRNLSTIADDLKRRKVALRILDLGIDTSTASGLHNLSFCS
jgi:DNA invertase Pin-like site-specific DNA recombinase